MFLFLLYLRAPDTDECFGAEASYVSNTTLPLQTNINRTNNQRTNERTNDAQTIPRQLVGRRVGGWPSDQARTSMWFVLLSSCTYTKHIKCMNRLNELLLLLLLLLFVWVFLSYHDSANFPGNCCGHGQTQPVNANIDYNKKLPQQHQTSSTTFARVGDFAASPDCITYYSVVVAVIVAVIVAVDVSVACGGDFALHKIGNENEKKEIEKPTKRDL